MTSETRAYTTRQQQYLTMVGGAGHQSAVEIIGNLERELAAKDAELAAMRETMLRMGDAYEQSRAQVVRLHDCLYAISNYPEAYKELAIKAKEILASLPEQSARDANVLRAAPVLCSLLSLLALLLWPCWYLYKTSRQPKCRGPDLNPLNNLKPLIVHTEPQAKMFTRQDKESGIKRTWKVGDEYWQVYRGGGMTRIKAGEEK